MPQSPYEIIAGPADVFVAPIGEAFPDVDDDPTAGTNWVSLGDTEGGVTVARNQTVNMLRTDQTIAPVKAIRPEIDLEITFSLAHLTLENLAKALNSVSVTPDAGPPATKSIPIAASFEVEQLAMLIKFPSPYANGHAQWQIPRVVMSDSAEMSYVRDDKTVATTTWMGIADPDAATPEEVFGTIVAATEDE